MVVALELVLNFEDDGNLPLGTDQPGPGLLEASAADPQPFLPREMRKGSLP